ncbi:MAG: sigma-70 family RNA polymerase sigma factor [Fimbriimonadaceae bacterium]
MQSEHPHVAFDLFYAENAMPAYRFALRLSGNRDDAEDLAAQALAKAYRRWSQYKGDSASQTWLFAIILNEWRMLCRKRPVTETRLDAIQHLASTMRFEDLDLAAAIQSLPDSLREAFLLVKGEGLTHAEAARVVKVPVGTMYFRVHSAVRKLRSSLSVEPELQALEEVTCNHEM